MKRLFKRKKKPTQTLFVYCPRCKNDLCSNNNFLEKLLASLYPEEGEAK